ncbi:ATP-binding protein [Jatrophihabitans sp.]|uniref:sensor histidine kinase n=1 Tax=Jatrophihabitans sp. TaxID=1932789 RepID=UPI0030C6EAAF|nr:multi-sensor signal transduction histidine kinase [Jatrophihabitans sp.]
MTEELRRSPVAAMRRWSLRARVGRVVLALLVFVALLLTVVGVSFVRFIHRGDDVIKRWQPAVSLSQDVLSDLVNQETGIRGYALSGVSSFLQPYDQYRTQETADEAQLRRLIGNRSNLIADVDAFAAAAKTWRTDIAAPFIERVREHDPDVATAVAGLEAKHRFDAIRGRAARLTADLTAVRHQAGVDRRNAAVYVWTTLGVTAGLILVVFYAVWRGLRRSVLDPIERLAQQTRQVAGGDTQQHIVPFGPPEIAALGADVDAMRSRIVDDLDVVERARLDLLARTGELARSNADLEQFAYVASHDLSEPLRKVANFCQLLERQYGPQLDPKARQYIDFAVDGAKRMQVLINDLLAFSRVGRTTEDFAPVELAQALRRALANLDAAIAESGAVVEHGELPTVRGDSTLLVALLQNLVGNAIKYRSAEPPRVQVVAELADGVWTVSVSDNGIGIEPQYAERIFAIFQRLHLRDEYGGTGIGLALCRKIVEFHGGRIWLADHDGPGATLSFTIPDKEEMVGTDAPES